MDGPNLLNNIHVDNSAGVPDHMVARLVDHGVTSLGAAITVEQTMAASRGVAPRRLALYIIAKNSPEMSTSTIEYLPQINPGVPAQHMPPVASISTSLIGALNSRQVVSCVASSFFPTSIASSNHFNTGIIWVTLSILFLNKMVFNFKNK